MPQPSSTRKKYDKKCVKFFMNQSIKFRKNYFDTQIETDKYILKYIQKELRTATNDKYIDHLKDMEKDFIHNIEKLEKEYKKGQAAYIKLKSNVTKQSGVCTQNVRAHGEDESYIGDYGDSKRIKQEYAKEKQKVITAKKMIREHAKTVKKEMIDKIKQMKQKYLKK